MSFEGSGFDAKETIGDLASDSKRCEEDEICGERESSGKGRPLGDRRELDGPRELDTEESDEEGESEEAGELLDERARLLRLGTEPGERGVPDDGVLEVPRGDGIVDVVGRMVGLVLEGRELDGRRGEAGRQSVVEGMAEEDDGREHDKDEREKRAENSGEKGAIVNRCVGEGLCVGQREKEEAGVDGADEAVETGMHA